MADINDLARQVIRNSKDIIVDALGDLPSVEVPATVVQTSEDGVALVDFGGETTSDDDSQFVEVVTGDHLEEGDEVFVSVKGNNPVGVTNPGWGDKVNAAAQQAATLANEAKELAEAIGQYAWNDSSGTHVSTEEAVSEGTRNILLNSYGILLRAASYYLAALTQSGIAFYDGTGNNAANVVASFGSTGAQVGPDGQTHLLIDIDSIDVVDDQGHTLMTMGYDSDLSLPLIEAGDGLTLRFPTDGSTGKRYAYVNLWEKDNGQLVEMYSADVLNGTASASVQSYPSASLARTHVTHGSKTAFLDVGATSSENYIDLITNNLRLAGTNAYLCFVTSAIASFTPPSRVSECLVLDTTDYSLYWYTA